MTTERVQGPHILSDLKRGVMLNLVRKFVRNPQQLPTIEEWSMRHANKASPDGIIAAVIVESLAKEFDEWKAHDLQLKTDYYSIPTYCPRLINEKKNIDIRFGWFDYKSDDTGNRKSEGRYSTVDWKSEGTRVNGIAIELKAARYIAAGYERIAKEQQKLQEVAARVKREMRENENKWNLAERLLGLTRDENGATVPIKTVEEAECSLSTESIDSPQPTASQLMDETFMKSSTGSMKPQASRRRTKIALA